MDTIILSGVQVYAHGGVTGEEKQIGQRYHIDVEMVVNASKAGQTDALEDTVSYAEAHRIVVETMRDRRYNLIETMAEAIAGRLLGELRVSRVTIEVRKLLPPIDGVVEYAAVRIVREYGG